MKRVTSGGRRFRAAFAAAGIVLAVTGASAKADTTLRVGKGFPGVFDFTPLDVGITEGFFKDHGLAIEGSSLAGASKLHQAMAAGAIDIGLGSGPDMAFIVHGSPVLAVAAFMGPPDGLVVLLPKNSPVRTVADLKGKLISVSTVGSLTQWLVLRLSNQQGWGPKGIKIAYLGAASAQISAMQTGNTDGMVSDVVMATKLQNQGVGRILYQLGSVAPNFITHTIYARDALIAQHPDEVRRFLAGWFETIKWMRQHKAESVKIAAAAMDQPPDIVAIAYDETMPAMSDTGKFEPKALAVLRRSFVEMGLLPKPPDMSKLYTERFLPSAKVASGH